MADGQRLGGRIAIVTGAAQGLGREYASLLAKQGASVVVNDLRDPDAVVREIQAAGGIAVGHVGDISQWDVAQAMIDTAIGTFGGLDVLVNNAGTLKVSRARDLTPADWERMLATNLMATVAPIHAAIGYWAAEHDAGRARRGSLVNTTSETALCGYPGRAVYGAGKAGVATLTVSLATELAALGVKVNAVAPRARTEMSQQTDEVRRMMKAPDDADLLDIWDPAEVAPLVCYLAMAECPFAGEIFQCSGGEITRYSGWKREETWTTDKRWTVDRLIEGMPALVAASHEGGDATLRQRMFDQLDTL